MAEDDAWLNAFFDFEGNPISSEAWLALRDNPRRTVAYTHFANTLIVTDWVGVRMGAIHPDDRPLVYQTLVWRPAPRVTALNRWVTHRWADREYHWPSREQAEAGHRWVVDRLRAEVMAESDQSR